MLDLKARLLADGFAEAEAKIAAYERGELVLRPGCDARQSLEAELTGLLGRVREKAGQTLMTDLPRSNAPRVMAECGSKGSALNVSQMIACLGQQAVDGKRIQNGFVQRTLPHFEVGALDPAARGFVANSFYSGLTATEFFFHTMGGREGLVDTAVKTAQTGYMARRLMKALEDLGVAYDGTVRNSESNVVQFRYGDDGLDPCRMETDAHDPVAFDRLAHRVRHAETRPEDAASLNSNELRAAADALDRFDDPDLGAAALKISDDQLLEPPYNKFRRDAVAHATSLAASLEAREKAAFEIIRAGGGGFKAKGQAAAQAEAESLATLHEGGVSADDLRDFAAKAGRKYLRAVAEPGEAVGAVGAQRDSRAERATVFSVVATGGWDPRAQVHFRARDADDAQDVSLRGRRVDERDARRAAPHGDHQRVEKNLDARRPGGHQTAWCLQGAVSLCAA